MHNNVLIKLSFLIIIFATANATYLSVETPISKTLYNNESVYLGKVGPGESFYILASANTTNAKGVLINVGWDTLTAIKLPNGWSAQPTPLYENPMKMKITVAPNASNGVYNMVFRAVNVQNYSGLGNLTFYARINVTPNVFNLTVTPRNLNTGVGQPSTLYITINNTGTSDDPFIINAYGLPAWNVSETVIALHSTKNTFTYPIYLNESGTYTANLTVSAATSPLIRKSYKIGIQVQTSLLNDYASVSKGVVLFPEILEPAYSFMLLLSQIYKSLTHT